MELMGTDQAETLRNLRRLPVSERVASDDVRIIAVASGKGGVGKTQLVANLAVAFARQGRRVLALDGDMGMANLDMALGVTPQASIADLLDGTTTIDKVLVVAREGVTLLPAGSGRYELANLGDRERAGLFEAIDSLENQFDTVVIDVGAGIGGNAVSFAAAAQDVIVVANLEPTSLADAYALIKTLATKRGVKHVRVVANMVRNAAEGEEVYRRLSLLTSRFLSVGIDYLGYIARDSAVPRAVHAGVPVIVGEPKSGAGQCYLAIARKLAKTPADAGFATGGVRLFWRWLAGGSVTQ